MSHPSRGPRMSRRAALGLMGLGAATVAAGTAGWITTSDGSRLEPVTGQPLRDPSEMRSAGGRLALELTAGVGTVLAGQRTRALGYNGSSPGPTLRVRPGDEIALRLRNELDQPTNLHTHGLRVSPEGNSDNPFLRIDPGTAFDYRITVPSDHPTGTFWYHPHHHGTVADQLYGGLAGALIVDSDAEPPVSAGHTVLITDTTLDADGGVVTPDPMQRMAGRQGELLLVNGQHQPVIDAAAGDVQRWRVINACSSRALALRLDDHVLTQIALDGAYLPAPAARDRVLLAPGNRADVLVRPTRPGTYALRAEPDDRGTTAMGMNPGGTATTSTTTLATLTVTSAETAPAALPATPVPDSTPSGPITGRRQIAFTMGMGGGMGGNGPGMTFAIDGRPYDPDRTDQSVTLGSIEEWTITNPTPMAHPFHLHVWPFEVLATSAGTPPTGTLQDVVLVPARGWVRVRIPFTAQPGRSVYHCHVLDHEDAGMMATVHVR